MTTNGEWLDYLAHNAPDELAAWFDAEHVETEERALDGDTEPENEDSRERLEAEIAEWAAVMNLEGYQLDMIHGWLNRRAKIMERKMVEMNQRYFDCVEQEKKIDELQAKVDELTQVAESKRLSFADRIRFVNEIDELTAELDAAKQQISQFDAPKSVETPENPASKCEMRDFDDSREQLEADVLHHVEDIRNKSGWTGVCANYGTVIEWLDRQAAITEEQTRCKWVTASADEIRELMKEGGE